MTTQHKCLSIDMAWLTRCDVGRILIIQKLMRLFLEVQMGPEFYVIL